MLLTRGQRARLLLALGLLNLALVVVAVLLTGGPSGWGPGVRLPADRPRAEASPSAAPSAIVLAPDGPASSPAIVGASEPPMAVAIASFGPLPTTIVLPTAAPAATEAPRATASPSPSPPAATPSGAPSPAPTGPLAPAATPGATAAPPAAPPATPPSTTTTAPP